MENATVKRHTVHDSDNSYDKNEQYKQQLNAFNMRILEKSHHWSMKKTQTMKQARTHPKNKLKPPKKSNLFISVWQRQGKTKHFKKSV